VRWDPEDYARNSGAQLGWARELIARLALTGSEVVLDVGCGDGRVTAEFARALPRGHVFGVDSSPEFIAWATAHYPPSAYPALRFQVMSAEALVTDRPFDLVFSNAVLHWVPDHPAFLRGAARALRPGGRIVVSCGGAGNAAEVVAVMDRLIAATAWRAHFDGFAFPYAFHAPAEYAVWLPEAGFAVERCALVEKDMTHDGAAGMAGWIRTTWLPYTERVPASERERFVTEAVSHYLAERPLDREGRSHVRMVRLEVEAVRTG
jgi:trans-aconitate 2-methyltransferase